MVIIGAKGHAKDLLSVLSLDCDDALFFYDDVSDDLPLALYDKYPILRTIEEVRDIFKTNTNFAIGVGSPLHRFNLSQKFLELGGNLTSVISKYADIGKFDVQLGKGVNIMARAILTNSISVGEGALINAGVLIHHDVNVGKYCQISPGAIVAGGVTVGEFSSIGIGAKLLPNTKIGKNVTIGAGAVVTGDIEENSIAIGIPAKVIRRLKPLNF